MKRDVVADEFIMSAEAIAVHLKRLRKNKKEKSLFENVFFGGDTTFLCDYFMYALSTANEKYPLYKSLSYIGDVDEGSYRENVLQNTKVSKTTFYDVTDTTKSILFFFADCCNSGNENAVLEELKKILELSKTRGSRCVLSVLLPEIPAFRGETAFSLAERELSFYLEKKCEKTQGIEYYLSIEKIARQAALSGADVTLLRFDNVFAPDFYHTPSFDFLNIVENCAESSSVNIKDDDIKNVFTVSYVRDAVEKIFLSSYFAKSGHTYNVASGTVTVADIKELIYDIYPQQFSLNKTLSSSIEKCYSSLNCMKFDSLKLCVEFNMKTAMKHVISYITELPYDCSDNTALYSGRIKTIQALELEILKEIDRICVNNDIKYFLAGGSLLGAVRQQGAIPWDDDLDIGMLRKDYEKFRKICEKELSEKFEFSSPFNKSGSHYTIEKVRLKSTYYSTTFSQKNEFPDGVFVDVLVYDQTSSFKPVRVLQSLILIFLYYCIILRWYNEARREYSYYITKIILPFLRIFPLGFYHRLFEFFAKLFMNKKNAELLIDTVGKKLKSGPLPQKGLTDTVYVDFDGIKAPVPVDSTGYLNFAYGTDYMQLPNYSKRCCPHDFARIDLGKYTFDIKGATPFREVDLRGELYESEKEK